MSNRVDFFQSDCDELALAAVGFSVFVDGILCIGFELSEVVRDDWDNFGWAKLIYKSGIDREADISMAESKYSPGREVVIRQSYNGNFADSGMCSFVIFAGQIEESSRILGDGGEVLEIKARDFSAKMERMNIYGKRIKLGEDDIFLNSLETIFNSNGLGNAAKDMVRLNGRDIRLFSGGYDEAKKWSSAEIIIYLLNEYVCSGDLIVPEVEVLEELTSGQVLRDFNVSGMSLLAALKRCCEYTGLKFKFVTVLIGSEVKQAIVFYDGIVGRSVELNLQKAGERIGISKTNICKYKGNSSQGHVTNHYIGQGAFKVFEATLDLVKGWDSGLEDIDSEKFCRSNGQFYTVCDVWRKWCLNESGRYSPSPYNRGEAFDFSAIFETSNYQRRGRRFLPALTSYSDGQSLGYFLEVSFNNGLSWQQYGEDFDVLNDQCGIWLSSGCLSEGLLAAAMTDSLKFRITASVVSDERLICKIADGAVCSTAEVVDNIVRLDNQFKFRKVSRFSRFWGDSDSGMVSDEVDDTGWLYEFLRKRMRQISSVIEIIDVEMCYLNYGFEVGDIVVSRPKSRDVFHCRSDRSSISSVRRVCMDFKKQCTRLTIVRRKTVNI